MTMIPATLGDDYILALTSTVTAQHVGRLILNSISKMSHKLI